MISPAVVEHGERFVNEWNKVLESSNKYQLDYSWPSIGVVDLILEPFRGLNNISDEIKDRINDAAAYLADITHSCWMGFPDNPEIETVLSEGESGDVIIKATRGMFYKMGDVYEINITMALIEILTKPETPFPFYEKTTRYIASSANRISLFAIGLVTGLSPYGTGFWKNHSELDFGPRLFAVDNMLSESSSAYYQKAYATDSVGGKTELYRAGLILSPAGHKEEFPYIRGATTLAKRLKETNKTNEEIITCALNLAEGPDDLISSAGIAVAATLEGSYSKKLLLLAESKSNYLSTLWPAINLTRQILNLPANWIALAQAAITEQNKDKLADAEKLLSRDYLLGLHPLLTLGFHNVTEKKYFQIFNLLIWLRFSTAKEALDDIIKNETPDFDAILQHVMLSLHLKDYQTAEESLALLSNKLLDHPLYLELRGVIMLRAKNNIPEATNCFKEAFRLEKNNPIRKKAIATYLVHCLVSNKSFEQALLVTESLLKFTPSLHASINQIILLDILERKDEAANKLEKLERIVPMDRTVFSIALNFYRP